MKRLLPVFLLLAAPVCAQERDSLSLEQAVAIARQNSTNLRISSARVHGASAKADEANASMLPSLRVEASYKRVSDVDPFQVTVPFAPQPITISPIVLDNYTLRGTIQQPIFTGFKLRNNARAADRLREASIHDRRNDDDDLVFSVCQAYWTFYRTGEVRRLVEENVHRLQNYLADTENLLKAGMATRNDLLKIQVQLSTARLAEIDAANDVEVAMMQLNHLMGRPIETPILPISAPADSVPLSGAVGFYIDRAMSSRPDFRALESRTEASRSALSAVMGNRWPQMFLSASYYYSRPNIRYQPVRDEFKPSWDIGVSLQLDLWNWGMTSAQVEQANAALLQHEAASEQMKSVISLDVERAYLGVGRAREKLGVADLALLQAEENTRTTGDKYRNGLATSSDLLDAEVAFLQARTNLTTARIELEIASARLRRAVGSDDIGEVW